jgi:proteic killer suppression protein
MIRSFKDIEAEKIFNRTRSLKLDQAIQPVAFRKLRMLHNAHSINDLRAPPANRLEKLKGNREGQYSIRVNDQYRICFEWKDNDAFNVEIVDYHS